MPNPITIHHGSSAKKKSGLRDCPENCSFPIRGLLWDVVEDSGYYLSIQQTDFFGGHMQHIELEADIETDISFTCCEPTVFMVVMIEGFFRFYENDKLLSYAMGGTFYMAYNPASMIQMKASAGKHTVMVFALDSDSLSLAHRVYPEMAVLVEKVRCRSTEVQSLPMCRMSKQTMELWDEIRIASPNLHVRSAELGVSVSKLTQFYHRQLERGDVVKGKISVEIANALTMYIDAKCTSDRDVSRARIAEHIGVPESKIDGFCIFLFGKTLNRHIIDLRMIRASQLLLDESIPVGAVANRVGLSSWSYFYRLFFKYFGCTPLQFRKNNS
ncbi:helix-turn-helix transcriptional regulator [Sphingobacterium kyonggiense]